MRFELTMSQDRTQFIAKDSKGEKPDINLTQDETRYIIDCVRVKSLDTLTLDELIEHIYEAREQ